MVQIPNHKVLSDVKKIINELNTSTGLTSDEILSKVRGLFYENIFSARKNTHAENINPFTEQLNKGGKKVSRKSPITVSSEFESPEKKSEETKTSDQANKLS